MGDGLWRNKKEGDASGRSKVLKEKHISYVCLSAQAGKKEIWRLER